MSVKEIRTVVFITIVFFSSSVFPKVELPSIISDHMVIQQNANVPIWGWGKAGELVKVKGNWMDGAVSTTTSENGKWFVMIKSPSAGKTYEIVIEGENEIVIKDVLAGEVWLASGQSQMAFEMKNVDSAKQEIANSDYPEIRLFHVEHTYAAKPQEDCNGKWVACSSQSVRLFSAVAYFFGRDLYKKLNIPIGLISASKGGSPIESWISNKALVDDLMLSSELNNMWKKWEEEYPASKEKFDRELKVWEKNNKPRNEKPEVPVSVDMIEKPHRRSSYLYNAMIAPIVPYSIKGVIWYQGGNNMDRPIQYRKLFPLLIRDWRSEWDIGNFPFYYCQLTPYNYKNESDLEKGTLLRESQAMAMSIPNTGMVVTVDIGDLNVGHPTDKQDVGKRLALWALAKTYGFSNLVYSGPMYKSMEIEGSKIRIHFDYAGSGLMKKGRKLTQFKIAGKDRKFYKADAVIDGSTVVVYSDKVPKPVAVRFSWSINVIPKLYNKEGLPAAPFRTDNWQILKKCAE